jgi:hypothetical protein
VFSFRLFAVVIVVSFFGCWISVFRHVAFVLLIARCLRLGGFVRSFCVGLARGISRFLHLGRYVFFALRWATETYVFCGDA